MRFFRRLRARYRKWNSDRKLKKSGYLSWFQYARMNDQDVLYRASRVRDFYNGYPFLYCFENRAHLVYDWDYRYDGSGSSVVVTWCQNNLRHKHRFDCHRVFRAPSTTNEWEFNDLGGSDYIFVAFKDETDYTMFLLRYA
jgi:hypothetical protein